MNDIYKPHVLDHYANPRNWGRLDAPDVIADADDPSCGDQVHIEIHLDGTGRVEQVAFEGEGCMVSMASASMFTEYIGGKSLEELETIAEQDVLDMLDVAVDARRRRCALTPLVALRAGLKGHRQP